MTPSVSSRTAAGPASAKRKSTFALQGWSVHGIRVALLLAILVVIRLQHDQFLSINKSRSLASVDIGEVVDFFPEASKWGDPENHGGLQVLSSEGATLGYVVQTAPESDRFLGFSGPTNLLVAFDLKDVIVGVKILSSNDTRDHVDLIRRNAAFMQAWKGLAWSEAAAKQDVDGVAGATLTSLAILQGLQQRLGAATVSTKFPKPLEVSDALKFFPTASRLEQDKSVSPLWHVYDADSKECGAILRTSPAADEIIGYQGPTESRVAFLLDGQIIGISIADSFDNEPYVGYVRGEASFEKQLKQFTLRQWSELDTKQAGIEGVSGATMTSIAVAQGLMAAAQRYEADIAKQKATGSEFRIVDYARDLGTAAIVVLGMVIGLTSLRGQNKLRIAFQVLVIAYLGLVNGDLLSMAMFAGWAQNGVPIQNALGLVLLTASAIALPIFARSNIYCSHLCPHGAVQQLLPRRWKLKNPLPTWLGRTLVFIRPALIVWVILVTLLNLRFSLVDIEPFDAYAWRSAGWPTVAVAIVGIIASLKVPMAYCRYGCGTGAVLQFLRRNARSHQLNRADLFAFAGLLLSLMLYFVA